MNTFIEYYTVRGNKDPIVYRACDYNIIRAPFGIYYTDNRDENRPDQTFFSHFFLLRIIIIIIIQIEIQFKHCDFSVIRISIIKKNRKIPEETLP